MTSLKSILKKLFQTRRRLSTLDKVIGNESSDVSSPRNFEFLFQNFPLGRSVTEVKEAVHLGIVAVVAADHQSSAVRMFDDGGSSQFERQFCKIKNVYNLLKLYRNCRETVKKLYLKRLCSNDGHREGRGWRRV